MDPTDLENALAVQASSGDGDFDVIWVDPPPHFNAHPTIVRSLILMSARALKRSASHSL
jgi:ABC-type glycerol-3-phosphate transport system substrate-binding protein